MLQGAGPFYVDLAACSTVDHRIAQMSRRRGLSGGPVYDPSNLPRQGTVLMGVALRRSACWSESVTHFTAVRFGPLVPV